MSALYPPPQTRIFGKADARGNVTVDIAWFLFMTQGLYDRVGGALGASTTDLEASAFEDAGIEELKIGIYRLADQLDSMTTELNEVRERLTVATRQLQDINEGQLL